MPTACVMNIKRVSATDLRSDLKQRLGEAKDNKVLLVHNRRQEEKYVVDKRWLDSLVKERESIFATIEILADRSLTNRLLKLSETIDDDLASGRLLSTADVFGE
jgi:hypothetical protein